MKTGSKHFLAMIKQRIQPLWATWMKIVRRKSHPVVPATPSDTSSASETALQKTIDANPYLQSKLLWNELYGSVQTKLDNSYRLITVLAAIIIVMAVGLIVVAHEVRIKPFVTIIHGGQVFSAHSLSSPHITAMKPHLALYFAKQFIRDSRSVSSDGLVNRRQQIAAYAFLRGEAVRVLHDYLQQHAKDRLAQHNVTSVTITSVLRDSPHTLTLRWQELVRDVQSGQIQHVIPYIAQLTYTYTDPSQDPMILKTNPFGFVITHLSWTRVDHNPLVHLS